MIFTLIKKELRALFLNPVSLTVISILNISPVIAVAIYLKLTQTNGAYAGFETVVSLMAMFFAVLIPVVSSRAVSDEKKQGTYDFLLSMPISKATVIISKLLSHVIFFAVPTAVMAVFPLIFSKFGDVNYKHCYLALLMLFLFEIFVISLSLMLSTLLKKSRTAMIAADGIMVLSFLFGILSSLVRLLPLGTGFDRVVAGMLAELSLFKKLDAIVFERFDITTAVFFALGTFVFILVALFTDKQEKKKTLFASLSILLVACVGILPMLMPYKLRQIDLSESKLYTPNSSVKSYLSQNEDPITVYLIDPYTNEEKLYYAIINTVESGKNIKLQIVNSSEDTEFLKKYGLEGQSQQSLSYAMVIESDARWKFINGEDYFSYYNKSMGHLTSSEFQYRYTYCATLINQYYPQYDKLSAEMKAALEKCAQIMTSLQSETFVCLQVEDAIAEAVAYVTADCIPTVYFLTGHGEEGASVNPYDFKSAGYLPINADLVVINSPSADYSAEEISTLIKYVDNGGKLYILADTENYSMPNFASLLAHYGLSVDNSVISVNGKTEVPVSVNKEHGAFSAMSASEVTLKNISKITISEGTKYKHTTMLSYNETVGEGESASKVAHPVALSVSEDGKTKITLFTGAITFNSLNNGLTEEELERVSPCVSNTMAWMFEPFDSGLSTTPAKIYDKALYLANDGDITKITVLASVAVVAITAIAVVYMVTRNLRSKKAVNKKDNDD